MTDIVERLRTINTCQHYACRCARAAELAAMADTTGNAELLAAAVAVHTQNVRCRGPKP